MFSVIDPNLQYQAGRIKEELEANLLAAYSTLRDFSETYGQDSETQEATLLLGSLIFDVLQEADNFSIPEEKKKTILVEAFRILDKIVQQTGPEDPVALASRKKLREYFLSVRPDKTVFRGERLEKVYSKFSLQGISLELKLGEITGIIGENGNGKTTLLEIVAGELSPSSGSARFMMADDEYTDWRRIKRDIGYVPQQIKPWRNTDSIRNHLHFTAALKGITGKKNEDEVNYIIARLGLEKHANTVWGNLSGGFQLRCELARQLVWSPKLLVLDEPLANLDVKAQSMLLYDLRNLSNSLKSPMAVLISSQNIYDLEHIADNVVFIRNGKAIYNGPVERIQDSVQHRCYILDTRCSVLELQAALSRYAGDIIEIKDYYQNKLVFTSQAFVTEAFLSELIRSGVHISSFRDISNSTRIFFENDQFNEENAKRN